jgi:hypothetical protein
VVIKLYKPGPAANVTRMRAEFDKLRRLHAAIDRRTINGWHFHVPTPLCVCDSPLAVVMAEVPGIPLSLCLQTAGKTNTETLESAAGAVVGAMQALWSTGQLHGDLNFDNILCDMVGNDISFIDPGDAVGACHRSDKIAKPWYPASHDLAYMLFDTAVRGDRTFRRRAFELRQRMFAEKLLRAFLRPIPRFEERQQLFDQIRARTAVHLKELELSLSPRGLWHALLRYRASRRIDRVLAGLADAPVVNDRHAPNSL